MNSWFQIALQSRVYKRALKTSLFVGTLLVIINQSGQIIDHGFSSEIFIKIILTYLVPYCVSTYASVEAIRDASQFPANGKS